MYKIRVRVVVLATILVSACASLPGERTSSTAGMLPNPLMGLQPSAVVSVRVGYDSEVEPETHVADGVVMTVNDGPPPKYLYTDCEMYGALAEQVIRIAALAVPTIRSSLESYPTYFLNIQPAGGATIVGYLFDDGVMYIENIPGRVRSYQLSSVDLGSLLVLLKSPGRVCKSTIEEGGLSVVPVPDGLTE